MIIEKQRNGTSQYDDMIEEFNLAQGQQNFIQDVKVRELMRKGSLISLLKSQKDT